mmetsp:Transcript_49641/g.153275  ORF Transcript_49641/g.153275 Transcript_49641/m.153275 type:complete len:335 (+) Transcript_49641:60-1064(+)
MVSAMLMSRHQTNVGVCMQEGGLQGQLKRKLDMQYERRTVAARSPCNLELDRLPQGRGLLLARNQYDRVPRSPVDPSDFMKDGIRHRSRSPRRTGGVVFMQPRDDAVGAAAGAKEAGTFPRGLPRRGSRSGRGLAGCAAGCPCALPRPGEALSWSVTAALRGDSAPGFAPDGPAKRRRVQAPGASQDKENLAPDRKRPAALDSLGPRPQVQCAEGKSQLQLGLPDRLSVSTSDHLPFAWTLPLELNSPPPTLRARGGEPRECAEGRLAEEPTRCGHQAAGRQRAGRSASPAIGRLSGSRVTEALDAMRRADRAAAALAMEVQRQLKAIEGKQPR